jgi:hypothetical protein
VHTSHKVEIDALNVTAPPALQAVKRRAVAVAGLFGIGSIVCFFVEPRQALQAYLVGYMLFLGFTLGCLGWLMLWHLTSGRWGLAMRRIWEAGTRNIWATAIAFLPVLIGYKWIFPWADSKVANNPALHSQITHYLNYPFFVGRAILYFALWMLLITLLNRWSAIQDRPYDTWLGRKFNIVSSAGMVIYFWTMFFASVDWMMSLSPGWSSTIFGLIIVVGQGLLGMCLALIMGRILVQYEPMNVLMDEVVFWDNGKLLLAFVMLWAYLSFSQWLITWSGNLPEEIHWYTNRIRGGWGAVALFLVVFHFAVPFIILLSQSLKKNPAKLALLAGWMIFMRFVDLFWVAAPSWSPEHVNPGVWMYAVVPVFMVGLWVALFISNYVKRPVVALYDPRMVDIYGEAHE